MISLFPVQNIPFSEVCVGMNELLQVIGLQVSLWFNYSCQRQPFISSYWNSLCIRALFKDIPNVLKYFNAYSDSAPTCDCSPSTGLLLERYNEPLEVMFIARHDS